MASRRRQPKYTGGALLGGLSKPREPIDLATLTEARLKQYVALIESRAQALREVHDLREWEAVVEQGRGLLEASRLIVEEGRVAATIDELRRGMYLPIEPKK